MVVQGPRPGGRFGDASSLGVIGQVATEQDFVDQDVAARQAQNVFENLSWLRSPRDARRAASICIDDPSGSPASISLSANAAERSRADG